MADHLWTGDELETATETCKAFIAQWGERGDGVFRPWPNNPEQVAKAAFVAGWTEAMKWRDAQR